MNSQNKLRLGTVAALAAALIFPMVANADFVNFNEQVTAGKVKKVDGPLVVGGLSVSGGQEAGGGTVAFQPLTIANFGSEVGLGVCGTGDVGSGSNNLCDLNYNLDEEYGSSVWNGQKDELENDGDLESINISEVGSTELTGQFKLGSFDGAEAGYVTYGQNTVTFQRDGEGGSILSDTAGGSSITLVSGDVFLLTLAGFDSSISNVTFYAGCASGVNGCTLDNDYLVAGASVVPIPAAVWLFGSALIGMVGLGRRKMLRAA